MQPGLSEHPLVQLTSGTISGRSENGLNIYRGIPYAQPPLGNLRWKPPQPPAKFAALVDAKAFGPSCIQPDIPRTSLYYDPPQSMSEDCLFLNIWTEPQADKRPVIVWIHGGSLRMGGSEQKLFSGDNFAHHGVVFVSLNYRLGPLGWMAHPQLSAESQASTSGNYGLMDQITALNWIKENIASFGGDPSNITIMGESAGALSVTYLLMSPKAESLFHKAIVQSTNMRAFPELKDRAFGMPSTEELGQSLVSGLGYKDIAEARSADPVEFTTKAQARGYRPEGTIDNVYLTDQLIDTLDNNKQNMVPLLAGFTSGETRSQRALIPPQPSSAPKYEHEIRRRYGKLSKAFLAQYPSEDLPNSLMATMRDAIYGWGTERLAKSISAAGAPSYFYVFDYCYNEAKKTDLCAFHASELPFVFGNLQQQSLPPNWPQPYDEEGINLSQMLIEYWTSFAKTGQPESQHGPVWTPYSEDQSYLLIQQDTELKHDPFPGMLELHETLVQQRKNDQKQWMLNVGLRAPIPNEE